MAEETIDREQFDCFTQPIPRKNLTKAIELLGFDARDTLELTLTFDSVAGTAFVRGGTNSKILGPSGSGYLKFDFTAPVRDDEDAT